MTLDQKAAALGQALAALCVSSGPGDQAIAIGAVMADPAVGLAILNEDGAPHVFLYQGTMTLFPSPTPTPTPTPAPTPTPSS